MEKFPPRYTLLIALLMQTTAFAQFTLETVPVGDAGNHADPLTGFGAVSNTFRIGKFEVKNSEYVTFLNAVDPDGINTAKLYDAGMNSDARGGISFSAGNSAGTKYAAKINMADKPVNFVAYYAMLRFANWMHHGASNYASSALGAAAVNDGAYTLNGATAGPLVAKNPGATWWLPTEDEWYKAAYYKGGSASAGYWSYATQSDTKPGYSSANASGTGSAGSVGNFANTDRSADWNGEDGNVTTAGSNGGPGPYGTFDQNGNVLELCNSGFNSFQAVRRGGSWNISSPADLLTATNRSGHTITFEFASSETGFRLATETIPPPPPDAYSIFIHDGDAIGYLSFSAPDAAKFHYVGKMGSGATGPGGSVWTNALTLDRLSMMDIAWSRNNQSLYALSSTRPGTDNADAHLWTINTSNGLATLVSTNGTGIPGDGTLGADGRDSFTIPNALGLDATGKLITAITTAPRFYEIDPASGAATEFTFSVAGRPNLKYSMGGLATHRGRTYILLSTNRYNADGPAHLVELVMTNPASSRLVGVVTNQSTGQTVNNMTALAATPHGLYGYSSATNSFFRIDTETASATPVNVAGGIAPLAGLFGAAAFTELGASPAQTSVFVNGTVTFAASGGFPPYQFALISNASGGSVHPFSGVYVAGPEANGVDLVRVTDAYGIAVTSTVSVLPSPEPRPDLVVVGISAPASATPGVPFNVVYVVSNRGAAAAFSARQDFLFVSDDAAIGNDVFLATRSGVDSLAPGASVTITQSVVIGVNGPAGDLRFVVAADGNARIAEEDESNNSAIASEITAVPFILRLSPATANVAEGAAASLTLSRNGSISLPLVVNTLVGLPDQLSAAATITIPAGALLTSFFVTGIVDGVVDGSQNSQIIVSAAGFQSATSTVTVTDVDVATLLLTLSTNRLVEGEIGTGTVSRVSPSPSAATITLSGGSGRLAFAGTVTIPPGAATTNFLFSALQNTLIETNQSVNLNASAAGFSTAVAPVLVVDDDTPVVTITLSAFSVAESAGNNAVVGTVTRSPVSTRAVNVDLSSSLPGAVQLPPGITIPASAASANFAVIPLDNQEIDGDRTVVINGSVIASQTGLAITSAIPANLIVTDDDGPSLQLTAATTLVGEGQNPATIINVRRNSGSSGITVVNLASSNPGELTVPATVTIPDGTNQATFAVATIADGVTDGNQSVIVLAESAGFASASIEMTVTDTTLADLLPVFLHAPTNAASGERINVEFRIENRGFASAANFSQRISLSTDPLPGGDALLTQSAFGGTLTANNGFTQTLPVTLPATTGTFWLVLNVDALNNVGEVQEGNNTLVAALPIVIKPAYSVTVQADIEQAAAGTPVVLSGSATRTGSGAPAAFELVRIHLTLRDTVRLFSTLTDASGNFSFIFEPLPGEAGVYSVGADHPAVASTAVQDTFTLSGFSARLIENPRLTEGATVTNIIAIQNLSPVGISGLSAEVLQESGAGFSMNIALASTSLAGDGTVNLLASITAPPGVGGQGAFRIRINAPEANSVALDIPFTCDLLRSRLQASPSSLLVPMVRGEQVVAQFTITNNGGRATAALQTLTPPIPWVRIIAGANLSALAPGATATISLLLSPPADLPLGDHTGNIVVNGADSPLYVPFTFRALSTLTGDLLVTASDELTFYAAGSPRLTNATVTLSDAYTREQVVRTNFAGASNLLLAGLPEAYYEIRVESPNHTPFTQSFLLLPGTENRIDAFLPRQTVKITWTVDEIEIEDRYNIAVESTFEANLPIPVIVIEPSIFDMADFPGDTKQIDVKISNHGLIAARNGRFDFPQDPRLAIEPLITDVGDIPAMSSITVPVIFRKLPVPSPSAARGGGPVPKSGGDKGDPNCIIGGKFTHTVPCAGVNVTYNWNFKTINLNKLPGFKCGTSAQSLAASSPFPGFGGNFGHCDDPPCSLGSPGYDAPIAIEKRTVCDPCVNETVSELIANCMPLVPIPFGLNPFEKRKPECGAGTGPISQFLNCMRDEQGNLSKQFKEVDEIRKKLEKLGINDEDVDKAFDKGKKGLDRAGKLLDRLQCFAPLFDPCSFKNGGGIGGASAARTVRNISASALPDYLLPGVEAPPVTSDLAPFYAATIDFRKQFLPGLYLFGLPDWLLGGDELVLTNWVDAYMQTMVEESDEGALISADERAALLITPYPDSVGPEQVNTIIDRWNRSVSNWNQGRFTIADLPPGENTDIIDFDIYTFLYEQAFEATTNALGKGYLDLQDQYAQVRQETIARLTQPDDGGGVCARIRLRLEQQAVLSRTAFRAVLEVGNNVDLPIEDVEVVLMIKDINGSASTSLFQVRNPELVSLSAIDGTGIIPAETSGRATWIIVPTSDAAPTNETQHFVQGTLKYSQDGIPVTIPLEPAVIRVLPAPKLALHYFHERDVFSDDPFTLEVEPAIPYSLGIIVSNEGFGVARNFRITSGQPQIIENDKGLLADFQLIAAEVGGLGLSPSLTSSFGDINPNGVVMGRWLFKSSIQGLFIDYDATFEHVDGLGDKRLSLIDRLEIHEMRRVVKAGGVFDDGLVDFLVNDVPDLDDAPDTLWFSHGGNAPVALRTNGVASGVISTSQLTATLTVELQAGWNYLKHPDPSNSGFRLLEVRRGDDSALDINHNVWRTDRTFIGLSKRPRREDVLHVLDYTAAGRVETYTLVYEVAGSSQDITPPVSTVSALGGTNPSTFIVNWSGSDGTNGSGIAYFDIYVSVNGGPFTNWISGATAGGAVFEGEPGNTYAFFSRATDNEGNTEPEPGAAQAQTTTSQANTPPSLAYDAVIEVDEGSTATATPVVSDTDEPAQALQFSFVSGSLPGMTLNPATGVLSYPTGEATGPATHVVVIRVTDDGVPSLSATASVTIVVREVNVAPVIPPIADRFVNGPTNLSFTITATDADRPVNALSYSLGAGAPLGASIDPISGLFSCHVAASNIPGAYNISVVVNDDGAPSLSFTQRFAVLARDLAQTITFAPISPQFTTNRVSLQASASSGLPVGFILLGGPAQLNAAQLSFNASGSVSVVANQPGDATWLPAPPVTNAFDVLLTPAQITWSNPAPVLFGAALTETQLSATANIAGSFVYNPTPGAVLNGGTQMLNAVFTPVDTVMYGVTTASVGWVIHPYLVLEAGEASILRGEAGTLPFSLASFGGVYTGGLNAVRLTIGLDTASPPARNYVIDPAVATVEVSGSTNDLVAINALPGQALPFDPASFGLAITNNGDRATSIFGVRIIDVEADDDRGQPVEFIFTRNGLVRMIGEQPLIGAPILANDLISLPVYLETGTWRIEYTDNLLSNVWQVLRTITVTNAIVPVEAIPTTDPSQFIRLIKE